MQDFEQELIKCMRNHLPEEIRGKYPDDELLNIIDIVWDYYEDHGLLEIDAESEADDFDIDDLVAHAARMIVKDRGTSIVPVDVAPMVYAEIAAEEELDEPV